MRLIDADAFEINLINAIMLMKNMAKAIGLEDDPAIQAEIKAYQDILDGMKEESTIEPKRKTGRWIPVEEKLPDTDEDGFSEKVLVSFSNASDPEIGEYRENDEKGTGFYVGDLLETFEEYGLKVNAWMPLPKCYREKGEDKHREEQITRVWEDNNERRKSQLYL